MSVKAACSAVVMATCLFSAALSAQAGPGAPGGPPAGGPGADHRVIYDRDGVRIEVTIDHDKLGGTAPRAALRSFLRGSPEAPRGNPPEGGAPEAQRGRAIEETIRTLGRHIDELRANPPRVTRAGEADGPAVRGRIRAEILDKVEEGSPKAHGDVPRIVKLLEDLDHRGAIRIEGAHGSDGKGVGHCPICGHECAECAKKAAESKARKHAEDDDDDEHEDEAPKARRAMRRGAGRGEDGPVPPKHAVPPRAPGAPKNAHAVIVDDDGDVKVDGVMVVESEPAVTFELKDVDLSQPNIIVEDLEIAPMPKADVPADGEKKPAAAPAKPVFKALGVDRLHTWARNTPPPNATPAAPNSSEAEMRKQLDDIRKEIDELHAMLKSMSKAKAKPAPVIEER